MFSVTSQVPDCQNELSIRCNSVTKKQNSTLMKSNKSPIPDVDRYLANFNEIEVFPSSCFLAFYYSSWSTRLIKVV